MTREDEIDGDDGMYVIGVRGGRSVGHFYRVDDEPGWWVGIVHGRRRLFLPALKPLDVASRFMRT